MEAVPCVEDFQCVDCNLTSLGCEFLANALLTTTIKPQTVTYIRLDYNRIGSLGIQKLSHGLAQSETIRALSLQYCAIGPVR